MGVATEQEFGGDGSRGVLVSYAIPYAHLLHGVVSRR